MGVLSIGVKRGAQIRIGTGAVLTVDNIAFSQGVEISVDGKPYYVTELERQEILPDVFLSVGKYDNQTYARLAFEAPRRIAINRIPATV